MPITPDQLQLLEDMLGEDGYVITTVSQATEINHATKILYLQQALHQSCEDFNVSLDELNARYNNESSERLEVIRSLKTLNDLYYNNKAEYEADAALPDGLPPILRSMVSKYKETRNVLNHTFGFELAQHIRFEDETAKELEKTFQPLIYRIVQKTIHNLYANDDLYLRDKQLFFSQRRQLHSESNKKTNPEWRKELLLPKNQLLESQRQRPQTCSCGGLFCGRGNQANTIIVSTIDPLSIFAALMSLSFGLGRAGDAERPRPW
ncbi:MAG: hypothetical protein V4501_01045 [Pseudomonadota bacterium]